MDAEPLPPPVRATELAFAAGTTLILALSWARASPIASLAETLWLLAAVATTAALPAALLWARGQRRGRAWRAAIISAHRLLLFARLQHEEAIANIYLSWAPPSSPLGAVSWLMHLVMGSRALRLLYMGSLMPLELGPHLLVHTTCVACVIAAAPNACTQPLLDGPMSEWLLSWFNALMSAGVLGILPPGWPGGQLRQCTAALAWLCLFLGWLVPTFLVLHEHCDAPQRRQQQPSSPRAAAEAAGADAGAAADSPAAWVLSNIFLADFPFEHQVVPWCMLAVACWLAATVAALHLA